MLVMGMVLKLYMGCALPKPDVIGHSTPYLRTLVLLTQQIQIICVNFRDFVLRSHKLCYSSTQVLIGEGNECKRI